MSSDEHQRSLGVLLDHRAAHRVPLTKATMGLRSVVRTEQCEVEVSQRLKRVPTIIDKLGREPTMQLANMQDIGGCRAVLNSIDEVRRVQRRLARNRPPLRVSDYIAEPRSSGYRGVHVMVEYDNRPVEVQLRTQVMHEWAITVERLGGRLGEDLKSGYGPQPVLDLMEGISEVMAVEERGGIVGQEALDRLSDLRQAALPFLGGGHR
jgi:putative GTP pyrophosphokinase